MSVPTRTDPSRPDVPARRAPLPPRRRAGDRPAAVAARLAGAVVVLATLLVAFGGWLIVLL